MEPSKSHTVLRLYRRMIYTLMEVFEGDYNNFHKMRITIRREIEKASTITDEADIRQRIFDMEEARKQISTTLIQGKLQDGEFFRYKARPDLFMGFNTEVKNEIVDFEDNKNTKI